MTKKDYELIARVIKAAKPLLPDNPNRDDKLGFAIETELWNDIIRRFGIALSNENAAFKISTFEKACARSCTCPLDLPTQKCERYRKGECSPQ